MVAVGLSACPTPIAVAALVALHVDGHRALKRAKHVCGRRTSRVAYAGKAPNERRASAAGRRRVLRAAPVQGQGAPAMPRWLPAFELTSSGPPNLHHRPFAARRAGTWP